MSKQSFIVGLILLALIAGTAYPPPIKSQTSKATAGKSGYKEVDTPLKQIPNYRAIKLKYQLKLTPNQESFLEQNRFLLVNLSATKFKPEANFDNMLSDFDSIGGASDIAERKPEDTRLITPDIVLHAYHKYFELTLELLEEKELSSALNDFIVSLHSNLTAAANSNTGTLKERYLNLVAQVVLAQVLLENKSPKKPDFFETPQQEEAYKRKDKTIDSVENANRILKKYAAEIGPELTTKIKADLAEIYQASNVGASPLFSQYSDDLKTDYTQFGVRSHYTKNSALRAYFRTMIYLGRSSYYLQKDIGIIDTNLMARQFSVKAANGKIPLTAWNKIMTVTSFYAGQSDDLTYADWQSFSSKMLGSDNALDKDLAAAATIRKMAENLNQLRPPKIFADLVVNENIGAQTKSDLLRQSLGFRIFGQRFTFDAWVLNSLTAGQEKSDVKLPSTPSALFISAAFRDAKAREYSQTFLQNDGFSKEEIGRFLTKLDKKSVDIEKIKEPEWFTAMSSAWLYVLGSLTRSYDAGYPKYMQSPLFADKQLQTFLGSYTELKHDTLLYAKQSYAEMGGEGDEKPIPPVVKGFVEPNLDFWDRFNRLLDHTEKIFTTNGLFKDHAALARLQEFKKTSNLYRDIARKEFQGEKISDEIYEELRVTGLAYMADPFEPQDPTEESGKVALVADIHTDGDKGQILYEATAKPYLMLAIVGNEQTPRVVVTLVYNHYEFTKGLGKRLTDEDWRHLVYDPGTKLPAKNFWYQSLLVK